MAGLSTDLEFQLSGPERWLLGLLNVPEAPEPPDGSPDSIQVFRAGRKYYLWSVLVWAAAIVAAGFALLSASIPLVVAMQRGSGWAGALAGVALVALWSVFGGVAGVTFLSRRLNYGLRWYIVTDRSLRIRSGIFQINELTMTYSNIQEIRVASGPLQQALGIADVEVQAAGGGGDRQHRSGHTGRFNGVSNANEIRDLIVDRLRHYRDSGLGEAVHPSISAGPSEIAAATAVLEEARALRLTLSKTSA